MRKSASLLLAALLSLAFAPAPLPRPPKPDPNKDDLKQMQGTWDVVSRTSQGKPISHVVTSVVIEGGRFTYLGNGDFRRNWSLSLDGKKAPRWFDMKCEHAPFELVLGLYELKGDTLTMCYFWNKNERPSDMDGNKPERRVDVYKRRKR
jgi:uncharacterized protein (TIGR03067 family)